MDCHGAGKGWTFNSLIPDQLNPAREFVVQDDWTEDIAFVEPGCDAPRDALADIAYVKPYDARHPCQIRVEYKTTAAAFKYGRKPGVEQTGPREIVSRADDWWSAWQKFFFGR